MAIICVPREVKEGEKRVSLAPAEVAALVKIGHTMYIQTMAGNASGFSDNDYRNAGATVISGADIFKENALIVKVKELDQSEFPRIKPGCTIMLFAHFAGNPGQRDFFEKKRGEGVIAIPYEDVVIRGRAPIRTVMSKCAGELAAYTGCEFLRYDRGGPGLLPSDAVVSIIGAGNAGWSAKDALAPIVSLIHLFDIQHNHIPSYPHVLIHHADENAYALHLPHSDIIICAAIGRKRVPKIITDEHIKYLKDEALIIDIAIDEGGNCTFSQPTTHEEPIFYRGKVRVYAVPNIPGTVPRSATPRLSKTLFSFVERAAELMDKEKRAVSTEEVVRSFLQ